MKAVFYSIYSDEIIICPVRPKGFETLKFGVIAWWFDMYPLVYLGKI